MSNKPIIGCLALQGCVERHRPHVEAAGAQFRTVKTAKQFGEVDAFILPGGESTTMLKLIERFDLWDVLEEQFAQKPVWGICAGSILLATRVENPSQKSFGLMPHTAIRNGYGRQLESDIVNIDGYDVSFIRAPILKDVPENLKIHAVHDDTSAWIQDGKNMATTFHPELTFSFPSPMHKAFIEIVEKHQEQKSA